MTRQIKITDCAAAPNTGAYSPALRVGGWIFVSGQGPIDSEGRVVPGAISAQTRLTLENVRRLIEAAGGGMNAVIKCTCYLADIGTFPEFDAAYREIFAEPWPCRTTVAAGLDGIGVEIDAIAYVET